MNKKTKLVVLGVIRDNQGNVLLSQRYEPELPEVHLKWELPGGTNEFGETLEQTVEREVLEETGLEISVLRFIPASQSRVWQYPEHHQHTIVLGFECQVTGGKLTCTDSKVVQTQWMSLDQAKKIDLLEGTNLFLDHLV